MKLSKFEQEVMEVVWEEGEVVVPDVHRKISEKRNISYSSVKTMFDRLEEKGAVKRIRNYGRTILYGANVTQEDRARSLVKDFMKQVFEGSVRPLVSHALADETLNAADIDYLEQLVAQKKRDLERSS